MRKLRGYLLITVLVVLGCLLLLLDHAASDGVAVFRQAVNCPDTHSVGCYQMRPGVIESVSEGKTPSEHQLDVTIASQGGNLAVTLDPSSAEAPLVHVGADVMVEWWVGNPVTVWIQGIAIPTTYSLQAPHPAIAYIGWVLLWLAAISTAGILVNERVTAALAAIRIQPSAEKVRALVASAVALPGGGIGWIIKPRMQNVLFLPLALAVITLITLRLIQRPDLRPVALLADALFFSPALLRLMLGLRNERLILDRDSITRIDWLGRKRTWRVDQVDRAAFINVRMSDLWVPSVVFVGHAGSELLWLNSLTWNLEDVTSACLAIGIPVVLGYARTQPIKGRFSRRALRLAILVPTLALLVLSFVPLPPFVG